MKKSLPWHHTRLGAVVLWLGGIQFAVPVLLLVAVALALGTYLESTQNVRIAREHVYGAWWFIAVMALVCVSLIFAVVARYPWKRKHVGFITVHAGLVALIAGGFWSMLGRVEGQLALHENSMHDVIETPEEQLEMLEHVSGSFESRDSVKAPGGAASFTLAGVPVQVLERWENSRREEFVADDSPEPLRAIEIAPIAGPKTAWVGQPDKAGPPPMLIGLVVVVLPDGEDWVPPPPPQAVKGQYVFVVGADRFVLRDVGQEVFPGWRVTEMKRYQRAVVVGEDVQEGPAGAPANAAVQVKIADGNGTVEEHTAFEGFPDMVMGKPLEGAGNSGSRLIPGPAQAEPETLVVFGPIKQTKIGYIGLDGRGRIIEPEQTYPMVLNLGAREVVIHRQLARAHATSRIVKLPVASDNQPALVVRLAGGTELKTLQWKDKEPITTPDNRMLLLHYGPRRVRLPFSVRLADFRKTDYPGTEMAMAYESIVGITRPDAPGEQPFEISMNHPYTQGPWKVYQSGFMGEHLSIFAVMKDPGLWLTYAASALLCVGVLITFYSRSMSWGHPGIPREEVEKETRHESPVVVADVPADAGAERGDRRAAECGV